MLKKVINIVKKASKIMLNRNFNVEEKNGITNIVTTNDVKVQEYLYSKLSKLLPNSSFYCEENDLKDLSNDYVWIIDPIDGTTNYSRNITVCAISVGLKYKDKIILGVVYNPYQNSLYYASKDNGAYLNGKKIHVTNYKFNEAIMYTAFSAYDKNKSSIAFNIASEAMQRVNDLRRTGSAACELCNLACGRGDLFFELKLSPWDYAASSIIIKEAGGFICSVGKDNVDLENGSGIIATNTLENFNELKELVLKNIKD